MQFLISIFIAYQYYGKKNAKNDEDAKTTAVNNQPVLLPPFVEVVPAYHAAPPVAIESLILQNETSTVPEDLDRVNVDAGVTLPIVIKFPLVPFKSKSFVKVLVVPSVNNTVAG